MKSKRPGRPERPQRPRQTARPVTTLFLDIGGVLLTNGWDHLARRRAAETFKLSFDDIEARHHLNFDTYEIGKIPLDTYLDRVVFDRPRPFTRAAFRQFMFAQSAPCPGMRELMTRLKARHGLKIFVVSNEGRELNDHRIQRFGLNRFVDSFVSSCFVGLRKPDEAIFKLALDLAQVDPGEVVYVENTALFVTVAAGLGLRSILHTDLATTQKRLADFGLPDEG
ncbi:MAG: HAD family hydrolase [Planctomycetota bacterium]